jgi:hypothetical protein
MAAEAVEIAPDSPDQYTDKLEPKLAWQFAETMPQILSLHNTEIHPTIRNEYRTGISETDAVKHLTDKVEPNRLNDNTERLLPKVA